MTTYSPESQERKKKAKPYVIPEIIRALTPILIAAIGGVIGVAVLTSSSNDNTQTAGFGLASTAIAGAAGLAQTKNQPDE